MIEDVGGFPDVSAVGEAHNATIPGGALTPYEFDVAERQALVDATRARVDALRAQLVEAEQNLNDAQAELAAIQGA